MTASEPEPTPPRRPGRGLRLALIASLALNLLFLGLIAGGAMTADQRRAGPGGGPDMRALWRALPDENRQAMRRQFRAAGDDAAPDGRADRREELAALDAELLALLRAEDFDAPGFAALLNDRRAAMAGRAEAAQALFVAQLATLDRAERAAMADRYEARRDRRQSAR